jgi:hypothetical protein
MKTPRIIPINRANELKSKGRLITARNLMKNEFFGQVEPTMQ